MVGKQDQIKADGNGNGDGEGIAAKKIVVKLKPGTAAEKSIKIVLPESLRDAPVKKVIDYVMGMGEDDGLTREYKRIQERITAEMQGKYGTIVNGGAITGDEKLSSLYREAKSEGGIEYLEAEIVVASRQEGANVSSIDTLL